MFHLEQILSGVAKMIDMKHLELHTGLCFGLVINLRSCKTSL